MDQVIKIDINLVFTIINLLVLYLLMKKFLFGPIIKVMDVRKAMIDQQFAGAKEQEDQAKALRISSSEALTEPCTKNGLPPPRPFRAAFISFVN